MDDELRELVEELLAQITSGPDSGATRPKHKTRAGLKIEQEEGDTPIPCTWSHDSPS
jgi:hypothetical protein